MKAKHLIQIDIRCQDTADKQRAIEVINYHLETLNPEITETANSLIVTVPPIDEELFEPNEALNIIRQTLAQSLTFISEWKCTLHTTN